MFLCTLAATKSLFWNCISKSFCVGRCVGVSSSHTRVSRLFVLCWCFFYVIVAVHIWSPWLHVPVPWQVLVSSNDAVLYCPSLVRQALVESKHKYSATNIKCFLILTFPYLSKTSQHILQLKSYLGHVMTYVSMFTNRIKFVFVFSTENP